MKKRPAIRSQSTSTAPREFVARAEAIELGQFIKFHGLCGSGGEAKNLIREGRVLLNGAVETRKGKKLVPGDTVSVNGQTLTVPM